MANEPAIRKIMAALKATLEAADPIIASVFIDRSEVEPFGNAEIPAINILHGGTEFQTFDHASTLHRATVNLDMIVENNDPAGMPAMIDEIEARIVETLWADRTLGGLAQDVTPQSSEGNEQVHADEGARLLAIEILFLTPVGDHRTVQGTAGPNP